MARTIGSLLVRYGTAVLGVALATWLRALLTPLLHERILFGIFYLPVIFSAWYGGLGPSILALALGTVSAANYLVPPHGSLAITAPNDLISLSIYFLVGIAIVVLTESLRTARRRAEAVALENTRLSEELRAADRRKDEFLALLGHELRNPLAPIRSALHLLDGADPETTQSVRGMMQRQVQHIVRLVDDLLDISRVRQGKFTIEKQPVELGAAVRQALETSGPVIDSYGHELAISLPDESVWLQADPVRLAQVITNLLNNAAKYTNRGGRIWLAARREHDQALLSVRDSGIGIPAHLLPRLFDLFMQVDDRHERSQGGLGIGLALVRRLVEMHGGTITAASAGEGQGSEFTVRLPVLAETARPQSPPQPTQFSDRLDGRNAHPAAGPRSAVHPPARTSAGRRVLIVDDREDAANTLAMLVRAWKHDVRVVHDGLAAVEASESYRPDVVLLDIGLPGISGYDVARQLRLRPHFKSILLVALTGFTEDEDRKRSYEAGFDHHLVKPVAPERLEALLAAGPVATNEGGQAAASRMP
ncbi:MAG: ATP-binding protein [Pirellulales bacterium]